MPICESQRTQWKILEMMVLPWVDGTSKVSTTTSEQPREVRWIMSLLYFRELKSICPRAHSMWVESKQLPVIPYSKSVHFTTWLKWSIASLSNLLKWIKELAFKIQIWMTLMIILERYISFFWSYKADILSAESKLCENANFSLQFYVVNCHIMCENSSFFKKCTNSWRCCENKYIS